MVGDVYDAHKSSFADETRYLSKRAICPGCREDAFLEDLHYCTTCDYGAPKTPQQSQSQTLSQQSQGHVSSQTPADEPKDVRTRTKRVARNSRGPERQREREGLKAKRYREGNIERARQREWEYAKRYRAGHKEARRQQQRESNKRHPEAARERLRRWRKKKMQIVFASRHSSGERTN